MPRKKESRKRVQILVLPVAKTELRRRAKIDGSMGKAVESLLKIPEK